MMVEEIIAAIDVKYPNDVKLSHKWEWITNLDKMLLDEVLLTHRLKICEEMKAREIACMKEARRDYQPLIQPPYQDVYLHYAAMQIASINLDTDAYNNESQLYNNALLTWKNMFNRTHPCLDFGNRWRI